MNPVSIRPQHGVFQSLNNSWHRRLQLHVCFPFLQQDSSSNLWVINPFMLRYIYICIYMHIKLSVAYGEYTDWALTPFSWWHHRAICSVQHPRGARTSDSGQPRCNSQSARPTALIGRRSSLTAGNKSLNVCVNPDPSACRWIKAHEMFFSAQFRWIFGQCWLCIFCIVFYVKCVWKV